MFSSTQEILLRIKKNYATQYGQYCQYAIVISKIFALFLKLAKANMIENLKVFVTDLPTDLPLLRAPRTPRSEAFY